MELSFASQGIGFFFRGGEKSKRSFFAAVIQKERLQEKMKIHQWIGALFWMAIGGYVSIKAYFLGVGALHQPGPGFIFFVAGLLLMLLSLIDLAATVLKKAPREKEEKPIWGDIRWGKILLVFIFLSAYVFSLHVFGFLFSTFILMILLFKGIEPTKLWVALVASVAATCLSFFVFERWLAVPFPRGILGF